MSASKHRPPHVSPRDWILLYRSHDEPGSLNTPCRVWEGAKCGTGYGNIRVDGVNLLTHRIIMEEELRNDPELCVLHLCHVRVCVNPEHLFLGTKQCAADLRVAYDRQAKGENHGNSKLSDNAVLAMRYLYRIGTCTMRELGLRFNVSEFMVWRIIHRQSWAHLP